MSEDLLYISSTFQHSTDDNVEYCDMVTLLLDFLSAERDSDWNLHLETFQNMLSYDRAYDDYKYFLWGTIYIIDVATT